jgi:membrane-associated HD superfamily phosphohydrolase
MLADSVESATRVLQDATPDRIRELIDTIVEDKIRQGQLEEAPLTLREIGKIKAQFRKVLAGAFHHRIDHPATRHLTGTRNSPPEAPPSEVAPTPPGEASPTPPPSGEN